MINTIFHFVNDPTFDYGAAVTNGDISEYTIVFNAADRSIRAKNSMYGRMSRADMADVLGNMSDLLPVATDSSLGAIKIGYTSNTNEATRRYGVKLDESNKAYVEVPWTDTVTPVFDDTEIKSLISVERNRINNFISTLGDTIDAKNRELYADTAWVNEVFGNPDLQGTVAHAYRTAVDNYLMGYAVWDWVDPNDHTKGRVARISEMRQDVDSITLRVGTAEDNISANTTDIGALEVRAGAVESYAASIESKADATDIALSSFKQETNTEISGIKTAHTNLSSSVTSYENTNDGNLGNLIKMAASVLDLKASANAQGQLTSTADLASVITNGSFTGYSGLSTKVQEIDGAYVSQASLTSQIQALDVSGQIATATSGLASESYVRTQASNAESNAKGYADNVAAAATSTMYATVDDVCAGIGVTVTKNTDGSYQSVSQISADNIYLNGNTWAQYIGVGQIVADTLTAGTATIKASLTVGGSGTPGTITMKNASNSTIGVWNRDRLAVGTTQYPDPSNSAMLVNATGSGSLAKGNIQWDTNGSLTVYGSGYFNGVINASSGFFNGVVNATQFKAGSDEGFSITTSSDSLDFNYNGNRLAFFSLRSWDATNNQLADVSDNPTGFYLYMTNPLNGHLITINFNSLSFKDLNENQVVRHEATFYRLSNLNGKAVETPVTLYYSLENNTTKWWLHSDSATELTSSEMGTLYKKQQVNQRGVAYSACVQEVNAGIPYITTQYTLYEQQTLQNNAPTKTGSYAMATHLNTDGSSSTDKWFVVPNSTTYLDSLNTNWSAVFRLSDGRVNETTATTVIQSSNNYTVPTFNSAVSFINCIDENRNVVSILYPSSGLSL